MKPKIAILGISGESISMKVDHFHRNGETIMAKEMHIEPGGKGYNQAIACQTFGAEVDYLTIIGNDQNGRKVIEYLNEKEVKIAYRIVDNMSTTCATILTDNDGNNEVTVFNGVADLLNREDVKNFSRSIKDAAFLLIQLEVPDEALDEAIKIALENNVKIVINPAPSRLPGNHDFFKKADYLTPNEVEARDLFQIPLNIPVQDYGEYLKNIVWCNVIVTLGDKGALLVKPGYYQYFKAIKVKAVDTTGAGDIFNAGLVTMLALKKPLKEAIEFAIKVSAFSVSKPYVMGAIPKLDKI